jgi:hypothetical protein
MSGPLEPGRYLVLDQGVWENDRQKYPAGTPIPWDEAKRLRLIGQDDEDESVGGGVIGAPPPAHAPPGRQTRPVKRADSPHPRPKKDQ